MTLIGIFDLFRIGLGPSSSHTVGPMRAADRFMAALPAAPARVIATLYGSLAWTGQGHGTPAAILAGLEGLDPATADPEAVRSAPARWEAAGQTLVRGGSRFAASIVTDRKTRPGQHPNAMHFAAFDAAGTLLADERWYSIGGGFIVSEGEAADDAAPTASPAALPYPFANAAELLEAATASGRSIAQVQRANELALRPEAEVRAHAAAVAAAMEACIGAGLAATGELPGGLAVRRRAPMLAARLADAVRRNTRRPNEMADHASLWAIAVNEENAAGGRVVTAPTNGAAGVIPAVLRTWRQFYAEDPAAPADDFLLAAAAVGAIAKRNASISGAEVGCQGEVGVACAMAAAGLAQVLGATPAQVENAAEIGLEHHLGMTCDPIGGLVQIPCIERNAMGAVKAIAAASLALAGDGTHKVSLDAAIATMRQTGLDMRAEYKETARGGLAVHVTEC
ncbi:MAG: L-serine ammonia-lyase [Rhodospirillales bacterium]|nr:L-serine ammonia-lyase [Rhodospirillales bacterium]